MPLLPVRLQRQYGVIAASMESQLRFAEDLQTALARTRSPLRIQLRGHRRWTPRGAESAARLVGRGDRR
jgi:hypothetical protein